MAANTIVTASARSVLQARAAHSVSERAARAAARTAPRGAGLAPVVALPTHRADHRTEHRSVPVAVGQAPAAVRLGGLPDRGGSALRDAWSPALSLVPPRTRPARTKVRASLLLVALALVVSAVLGSVLSGAEEPVAAGHVVLQPGETLWDVAVRSAPAGVDPRRQLESVRRLNGFGPGTLDAWTVVLIPAP